MSEIGEITSDILSLLLAIQRWNRQIDKTTALILQMREENRAQLTPEEWETLRADDNEGRQKLIEAIQRAERSESPA